MARLKGVHINIRTDDDTTFHYEAAVNVNTDGFFTVKIDERLEKVAADMLAKDKTCGLVHTRGSWLVVCQLEEHGRGDCPGESHCQGFHGLQYSEMPYTEEAAEFFYNVMINICRLADSIEGFFGNPKLLAEAIEGKKQLAFGGKQ